MGKKGKLRRQANFRATQTRNKNYWSNVTFHKEAQRRKKRK